MKFPIFLFGSGRCGSTLLQRILNTHKEIVMWGEHEGFLAPLAKSFFLLRESRNMQEYVYGDKRVAPEVVLDGLADKNLDICWVNHFIKKDVIEAYRQLLVKLIAGPVDRNKVHWGFKEIRYRRGDSVHKMLALLFPKARYIFLFRNPVDMASSAIIAWRGDALAEARKKGELREFIEKVAPIHFRGWYEKNSYLWEISSRQDINSHIVLYEDLVAGDKDVIHEIFNFLGLYVPGGIETVLGNVVGTTADKKLKNEVKSTVRDVWAFADVDIRDFANKLGYSSVL